MKTIFKKDLANKKMFVTREFAGTLEEVWRAWTESEILDQWWAPKPWQAKTKYMDFKEGGTWLYCMQGPEGEQHWGKASYTKISVHKFFEATDSFCDENGKEIPATPKMFWKTFFKPSANGSMVEMEITFASEQDMDKTLEMGFQEGFSAAHENLDEYLSHVNVK
jgi:uncharacterized protein YndB with AHSA1/START domain